MSKLIEFIGCFGDLERKISISNAFGAGGGTYHLMFDNFYQGIIIKRDKWEVIFQIPTDDYTQGDLDVLIEIVLQNQ